MGVFFTGVLMMYQTTLFGNVLVSNAMSESSKLELARSRTSLRITGINLSVAGDCLVEVAVGNQGRESIADLQRMDVIAHFTSRDPMSFEYQQLEPADVVADELDAGNWTIEIDPAIYPFEPSIFNPGEEAIIHGKIGFANPADAQTLVAAVVGTPNGVVANFSGNVDVEPCN